MGKLIQGGILHSLNTRFMGALFVLGLLLGLLPSMVQGQDTSSTDGPPMPPPLNLPLATSEEATNLGTFWMMQSGAPMPYNPFPELPVYERGNGTLIVDDSLVDYVAIEQQRQAENELLRATARSMGIEMPEEESPSMMSLVLTTNDLYLNITEVTNSVAHLWIHPPSTVTNGEYGLYFKTNLDISYEWNWLVRCTPGQTNLVVSNLPPELGFFRLGDPTAIRPGFTNNYLDRNDDWSTDLVPIGFLMNFFGTSYTNLYVNNNGNVTFDSSQWEYTPTPLLNLGRDIIAPFWADVDTRAWDSGVMTYSTNTVDGHAAFGVSWVDVGYYSYGDDKLNSFQMILIDRSDRITGDFDLEFNYAKIQWETGSAYTSGGVDGLGGFSARAGYASASGATFELNGSGTNGALLDTNTVTGLIYTNFGSTLPGRYVFQFTNGVPVTTP